MERNEVPKIKVRPNFAGKFSEEVILEFMFGSVFFSQVPKKNLSPPPPTPILTDKIPQEALIFFFLLIVKDIFNFLNLVVIVHLHSLILVRTKLNT